MTKIARKTAATTLSLMVALLAPGSGAYEAAAQTTGRSFSMPVVGAEGASALGALSSPIQGAGALPLGAGGLTGVLPGLPGTGGLTQEAALPAGVGHGVKALREDLEAHVESQHRAAIGLELRLYKENAQAESVSLPDDPAAASLAAAGQAPEAAFEGSEKTKGKTLLLVGTSGTRPFILNRTVETARKLGLRVLLLDKKEHRAQSKGLIPEEDFIPAPIDNHDEKWVQEMVSHVGREAAGRVVKVDAVLTFLNPYAELAGRLVDRLGAKGNSGAAVAAAHTKSKAREVLSKDPDTATPFREVKSPEEAARAFRELGGGKFVLKPIHGGGGALVKTDVLTAEGAAAAYRDIDEGLMTFSRRPDAGFFILDRHPGIMIERQLEGPEVDVELVIQDGKLAFALVSDNPPADKPNAVEKGVTFPSQLSEDLQKALVAAAHKAVSLLGLTSGNMHVELIATAEGPRILEVNARMGGLFVWEHIKTIAGVDLVEQGIKSLFGAADELGLVRPDFFLESRLIIPKASGVVESIDGLDPLKDSTTVSTRMESLKAKRPGDKVLAAPEDSFDYIAFVSAIGRTYGEAFDKVKDALRRVTVRIRKGSGELVEQKGDYSHLPDHPQELYAQVIREHEARKAAELLDALERRDRIMKGYLKGQLALIASFAMYYSLFSPVALALAGPQGVGSGRSGYAGALALLRPLAGVLVERFPVRSILIGSFVARAAIWGLVLPAAFFAIGGGIGFLTTFVVLMFVDGAVVSINSLVDIDEGGIDLLAQQHHFPVDDELRNKYNAILDGTYSLGRVVLAPTMAVLGVFAAAALNSAAAALVLIMAASFAVPAVIGITFYARSIPKDADLGPARGRRPVQEEVLETISNLGKGLKLAWTNRKIRWRIAFNSVERAIEDSMLFVVLAEFGLRVIARGNPVHGALATAGLIAVGKLGALLSAWGMHRYWKAPKEGEAKYPKYRMFFKLAFAGTLAALIIPLAFGVNHAHAGMGGEAAGGIDWLAAGLAGAAAFLFNLFFEASQLGFRNLMQGIVSEQKASGRLFGIQGTILMGVNAAAILALSALFAALGPGAAFWISAGLYAAYGVFQLLMGPRLLFTKEEREGTTGKEQR